MSPCEALQDRMPDVLHGSDAWSDSEREHVEGCSACDAEWRLLSATLSLHADLRISPDRVSANVLARLGGAPSSGVIGRLPWRGAAIGLVAAAAAAVLILALPRETHLTASAAGDTTALAVLPELERLSDAELQSVLLELGPTRADATPGVLPHLGDLTDSELEQLLRAEGGE